MALQGRLLSVLQHLATSHRQDAGLSERVGVLQASLFLVAKELPIKRLASELLHLSKLQLFSQDAAEQDDRLALECAAAAVFVCEEKSGQGLAFLEDIVEVIFLPLLASSSPSLVQKQPEIASAMFAVLRHHQQWLLVHMLLNKVATSLIPASRDLPVALQQPLTKLTAPADPDGIPEANSSWLRDVKELPLHTVLLLVKEGLDSLHSGLTVEGSGREARACADSNVRQLLLCAMACLFCEDQVYARAASKALLPACLQAAAVLGSELQELAAGAVWDCTRYLLATREGRSQGLAILTQLQSSTFAVEGENAADWLGFVKLSLVDPDLTARKRAFFLLQKALPKEVAGRPPWSLFLVLFDVLEESAYHLIESVWAAHMARLFPLVEETALPAGCLGFDVEWLTILWRRALSHKSPQVQRMVLEDLMGLDWANSQLRGLPIEFVTDSLLPSVASPAVSKGTAGRLVGLLGNFLVAYLQAVGCERWWPVLLGMLCQCSSKSVQRTALQHMLAALNDAAVACGPVSAFCAQEEERVARTMLIITHLRAVAATLPSFQGASYQLSVSRGIIQLAATLLPGGDFELHSALPLLECFPLSHVKPGGPLRSHLLDWLQSGAHTSAWTAACAQDLFRDYIRGRPPSAASQSAIDPVEAEHWQAAASRFARLVLLAMPETGQQLEATFCALEEKARELYHRPYLARGSAERVLLMLEALLEAAEDRSAADAGEGRGFWLPQRLAHLFSAAHEELSMFTKAAWQTFWQPIHAPSLAAELQPETGARLGAPQRLGEKSSRLPPSVVAALTRASLALSCVVGGGLCVARCAARGWSTPRGPATVSSVDAADSAGSQLSPALSEGYSSLLSPRRESSRRASRSQDLLMPTPAARRKSGQEAPTTWTQRSLSEAAVQFVQCFASTPLPMPKASSSAAIIQAYAEIRGRALACLALTGEALAAAAELDASFGAWLAREVHVHNLVRSALQLSAGGNVTGLETARWQALNAALVMAGAAGLQLPAQLLAQVFGAAVDAVQASHEATLPALLRCIRCLLKGAIRRPDVLQSAAAAVREGKEAGGLDGEPLCAVFRHALAACWAALRDARHCSNRLFATFLQTLLLPDAFDCSSPGDPRWALHIPGEGPVHWVACGLLAERELRAARLMALASLQLTKNVTRHPALLPLYASSYKELLLYGVSLAENLGTTLEVEGLGLGADAVDVSLTLESIERSPFAAYKYTVLAGRVAAVCGIQLLTQLVQGPDPDLARQAQAAGECLWGEMFAAAVAEGERQHKGKSYHPCSEAGRQKLRLWQAVASLACFVPAQATKDVLAAVFGMLNVDTPPAVKRHQETVLVHLLLRRPELTWTLLLPRLRDYSQKPDSLASTLLVAARVVFHSAPGQQEALLHPTVTALLPWTMLHNQSIRVHAQVILQALLHRFPQLCEGADPGLAAVSAFFGSSPSMRKLDKVKFWLLRELRPKSALDPWRVFSEEVPEGAQEEDVVTHEASGPTLMDKVIEFLAAERAHLRLCAEKQANQPAPPAAAAGSTDLQRKPQPAQLDCCDQWEQALVDALPQAAADALRADVGAKRQRIVVVASLLDRAPNLAGLTRTCEVFLAERLVMADLRVVKDHEFQGISVTAEQHVPMEEVRPPNLPAWLAAQRDKGYALIGLEQTAEAAPLPGYGFPEKTVLVLGKEKEGIPPELLNLLDQTLVIPQLGVIRSLNAHVSASIALYEYTRCHLN